MNSSVIPDGSSPQLPTSTSGTSSPQSSPHLPGSAPSSPPRSGSTHRKASLVERTSAAIEARIATSLRKAHGTSSSAVNSPGNSTAEEQFSMKPEDYELGSPIGKIYLSIYLSIYFSYIHWIRYIFTFIISDVRFYSSKISYN